MSDTEIYDLLEEQLQDIRSLQDQIKVLTDRISTLEEKCAEMQSIQKHIKDFKREW